MEKSSKTVTLFVVIIFLLFLIMSWLAPKQIDWSPTYNTKDKIPMGMYVFDHEIDSILRPFVNRIKYPLSDYFYDGYFSNEDETDTLNSPNFSVDTLENTIQNDSSVMDIHPVDGEDEYVENEIYQTNLLYINKNLTWTNEEISNVCRFARLGNSVFISCTQLPLALQDSLNLALVSIDFIPMLRSNYDTLSLSLIQNTEPMINDNNGITGSYFTDYDTSTTQEIGYVNMPELKTPNFLSIDHGKGLFLMHLEPAVFTNFHMLKDKHHVYVEKILSYIPSNQEVIWSLNNQTSAVVSDSPLRFILSQPSLKWAWYLLLAGVFLFVMFNIRRSQRVISIIPRVANTSVDFVKTIGNLYFLEGDINNMIDKKITYLLEKIRSDYHLNTDELDDKFTHLLQLKSGKDENIVKHMIFLIKKQRESDYTRTIDDFTRLNNAIEQFYF